MPAIVSVSGRHATRILDGVNRIVVVVSVGGVVGGQIIVGVNLLLWRVLCSQTAVTVIAHRSGLISAGRVVGLLDLCHVIERVESVLSGRIDSSAPIESCALRLLVKNLGLLQSTKRIERSLLATPNLIAGYDDGATCATTATVHYFFCSVVRAS